MKSIKSTVERTDEEEMLQILGEKSPVGICIIQDGKFCYFNSNFPIAIGYTADELVGKDPLELIVPEDREMVRENEIKMLNGELHSPYQFRVIHKDGSIRWVMEAVRSIRYHERRAVLGSYMEVTERKQMEEALEESEEKYRELANSITNVFFAMDEHLRYTYWNRASEILTGIRAEDAIGKTLREIFPDKPWRRRAEKVYRSVLKTQQPQTFVNDYDIDGRHYVFEISAYPSRGGISVFVSDITERKQVIEALKQSEERYRTILEEMEDSYFEVDLGGHLTFVNSATCRKLGYSKKELIGMSYKKTTLEDDIDSVFRIFNEVYRTGKPNKSCLWTTVCKDGTHRLIEHSAFPLRNDKGEIIGFRGVGRDITERKQAEEKLQSSEERYRALFDSSVIGTLLLDAETMQILMGNEAAAKIFGFSSLEEGAGINVLDFVPQEDRELNRELIKKELFEQDSRQDYDVRAITKDGREIWINVTGVRMMRRGRLVGMVTFTDVTERKQAEEALKLLSSVTQQVSDATIITAADFNITYANKAAQDLFGYSPEEMLGKHMRAFNAEPLPKSREQELEQTLSSDKPWTGTIVKKRKDGSTFLCECHITPLHDDEGRISSYIDVMRDVTERKQAEEALQTEKNKLQSLVDAMEDGLTIQDRDYNIIYEGRVQRSIVGDHLGEKCYRVYEGREKICKGCPVEKAFKDGKSHTAERRMVEPSGEISFWENTANPIRDASGEIVSCLEINRNITERKRQEQVLADELTRRRILVDQSRDGIVILDQNGKVYEANQRFAEMLGYTADEVRDLYVWDWEYLYPHERVLEMIRTVDEAGDYFETQHRRKDDSIYNVEISTNGAIFAGQKLIFCVCRDITERKQAEEALQAERNKLQSLIDAMEDTLTIQDPEYNIIYQNELSRIASDGDHLGEKCYRVYEGRETVCDGCPVEQAFKDGKSHTSERMTTIGGKVTFWENTANPIRDAEGNIVSCLELTRDITERKKQEQALADEATRRRVLVDQSLDGIVVLDVDAKVVEANQRFADMLGYTLEEVYKLHTWDWDKQFPPEKILEMGRNVDEKGLHLETKHTRKDGSVIDVDISISGIIYGGQKLIFCIQRDVTERNRAEKAMRDSEESYRELADSITEVFFAMDEHLRYTYWNKASEILTGVQAEDALEKSLHDIFSDTPGLKRAEKVYRDVLRTQKSRTFINDFDIDGRHYIFEIGAYPSRDGISVFARDITERKRAEEALRQSEENYRALFDSAVIGTIVIEAETMKVIIANQAAAEMLGFSSAKEVIGVSPFDYVPPEDMERVRELLVKEFFEQDLRRTHELRMITKDGREIWISANGARIMHEGRLAGLASFTDITQHKKMEEAIRHAAEEWRKTFDSISDAISIHDRDFRIQRANKAFADIFNMQPSQIIGEHCYELHKGQKPISGCPHKKTLATKQPAAAEFYESHLGKYLYESTSPIFNEKGEIVGTVHITRDITEQKQQNERLMMADRLASIGELAAGTAHELNNPLTSIIGFSQLLIEKDIPDDAREGVELIYNEAQRAANVTRSLLTFGRKHAPVKQPNQINNIIEDVLKLRTYEQNINGIKVKKLLAPDLPEIMADYFQMQQVFLNIIINAEYFMTEARKMGTLTITTKKQNSNVRISFTDDGPGISRENLSRVFNPFFTTKEAGRGTGLGLSICHGIVSEHGGQIYARSQSDKGATIIVELPINNH
jgi:PAS domain S-box-containing protein